MQELENLVENLSKYSRTVILEKNNSKVLVLEKGARVLGISLSGSTNLLWVNPRIEEVLRAGDWNVGGLRLWISPERNFFYQTPERFEDWFCPRELDPGDYRIVEANSERVLLEGEISAADNLMGVKLRGFVRREIRLLEAEARWLRLRLREGLVGEYPSRINPWALAQVPVGYGGSGTVLIPVRRGAEPIHYFREIPKNRLKVLADHIAFKIDGNFVAKLGVKPEDLKEPGLGSIAYVSRIGRRLWSALVLRTSNIPLAQEDCLDVPKRDPNLPRAAIQSYNSGPEAFKDIKFGEIELQLTPAQNISGRIFATAEYDLIAFVGARSEVLGKIRRLLGIAKPRLY